MSQNKLLAYCITFLSILALISFSFSPFFEIQTIQLNGLNILSEDDFDSITNSYLKANILFLDYRELEKSIKEINLVKSVRINKKYPDTLNFYISEREPIAKINNNNKFLLFTAEGFIIDEENIYFELMVPEIKGLGYTLNNHYISFSPIFEEIVQALEQINNDNSSFINSIVYNDGVLLVNSNNFSIYLGSVTEIREKFKVLDSIIDKISEEDLDVNYIDLRISKKPVIKLK